MSGTSLPLAQLTKRRTWLRFGTRTVFVLIGLAALVACWARSEMVEEQRREELIATIQEKGGFLQLRPESTWRRRLGAWLRGKPATPRVESVALVRAIDLPLQREFVEMFPGTYVVVDAPATELSPERREFLSGLKSIGVLTLSEPLNPTDELLAWLSKVPISGGVHLSVNRLDDELLRRLADAGIEPFRIVDLSEHTNETEGWSQVTDDGLKAASRFRILRYICAGRKGTDDGVAAFKDLPALAFVELIGPGYTDASAETLANLSNLRALRLSNTRLTDAGIAQILRSGSKIRSLRLDNTDLGEESIAAIAGMPALLRIQFRGVPISPELATSLAKLSIRSLNLEGDYSDADVGLLAPLGPTLTSISLETPNVTDQGHTWIAGAGKLSSLQLFDTQVTAATVKLIKSPSVDVTLGGPNVCEATLPPANRSCRLNLVRLCGSAIDDETLSLLEPPYDSLELVGTHTTAAGLRSLKTSGQRIGVALSFVDGTPPPLTQSEILEIEQATGGLVTVTLTPISSAMFDSLLPQSSGKPSAEEASP